VRKSALSSFTVDEAAGLLADPAAFTDEARMHAGLSYLRAKAPVVRVDRAPYPPFWAVTKHADVMEIERNHAVWINGKGSLLTTTAIDASLRTQNDDGIAIRTMNQMDGQNHRALRAIAADWFRPKAMRALQARIDELARRYVDHMHDIGPECDFVTEVAANYPGYVILSLLGLPDDDYPLMQRLTNELFGLDDPEQQRGSTSENVLDVLADIFAYFGEAAASRRANPTADLTSAIANARVDGRHLSDTDVVNTCQLIATAGHDTTKSAVAGGLLALIENPAEHERLRSNPALMPTAVEEMLRWSTPVKEMMRTAAADTEIRGVPIAAGDAAYLSYVSANRDEDVFDEPFRFDITRESNRHLAFGLGVHFCLGAALARMEISSLFAELLPRLRAVELAGEPRFTATTFVGGLKHLPIRYELS
jgi:cytochrome P450